jgi:NAD(P)-dependent dehydrogenase (short-subunit alcohol dehydrogenase family)
MGHDQAKIWFITGISSGLGKALAEAVMGSGDFVIGTFRRQSEVDAFNAAHNGQGQAVELDVTQREQIAQVVEAVRTQFGRVDVLVNNAGFGFAGAVEEASEAEVREVFDTNFFGTLALTRAFLPMLREQKKGHIIQISSHSGFKSVAGFGIYSASKFALEGASEALAAEVSPLGIKLTIVEPGPFRTNFAGSAFKQATSHIADYDNTAGAFRKRMEQVNGNQEGDPVKAADAIIQIAQLENPPLRLPLGKIAIQTITSKLESVQADVNNWKSVAEASIIQ